MKLKNVLIVCTNPSTSEHTEEQEATLRKVKSVLKRYNFDFRLVDRGHLSKEKFNGVELVIAVGGDGTFLRASQFMGRQLIFGVNADIRNKEGFFMQTHKKNFEAKFRRITKNNFKIRQFPRLEAYVDGKKIETIALNEFFIGPRKSYHAAKYVISINGEKERQKSSGVLVATAAGSWAWAKACHNMPLPLNSSKFQFVVREPYEGKVFKNYKLKYGILEKNKKVTIVSHMLDGIVVADSVGKEFNVKYGHKAVVKLADESRNLRVIWFK